MRQLSRGIALAAAVVGAVGVATYRVSAQGTQAKQPEVTVYKAPG